MAPYRRSATVLCDNARMWLRDYHFDGLRFDAVHALIDTSAIHLLEQLATEIDILEATVGGTSCSRRKRSQRSARHPIPGGGRIRPRCAVEATTFTMRSTRGLPESAPVLRDFGSIASLATALRDSFVYGVTALETPPADAGRAPLCCPAGDSSWRRRTPTGRQPRRGERLTHLASPQRLKIAAALLLTAIRPHVISRRGVGSLEPVPDFTSQKISGLARRSARSNGRSSRRSVGPGRHSGSPVASHVRAIALRWDELAEAPHGELLDWYRALLALRRAHPSLRDGNHRAMHVTFDERCRLLVMRRSEIVVACNFVDTPALITTAAPARILLASGTGIDVTEASVTLPAESVVILRVEDGRRIRSVCPDRGCTP